MQSWFPLPTDQHAVLVAMFKGQPYLADIIAMFKGKPHLAGIIAMFKGQPDLADTAIFKGQPDLAVTAIFTGQTDLADITAMFSLPPTVTVGMNKDGSFIFLSFKSISTMAFLKRKQKHPQKLAFHICMSDATLHQIV